MYISAPNQSLTRRESTATQTSSTSSRKSPAVSIGTALLYPAFAVGSLIFSSNSSEQHTAEPYKSQIVK